MSWLDDFVAAAQAQLGAREQEALWSRGVSESQVTQFKLGHWNKVLPSGLPDEFVRFCRGGQRLDDVFVLPLTNILGQIKGLQFRHVAPEVKGYLTYFHDRDESVYFGLGEAIPSIWETETAWVVEGGFDVFPIQRVFPNVFAALTLGTNEALARLLRRFAKQVWVAYDNDKDGRRACADFKESYGDFLDVRIPVFPKIRVGVDRYVKDPNELWEVWGDARLREYLLRQVDPYINQENPHA
jgi:hypothetical protein